MLGKMPVACTRAVRRFAVDTTDRAFGQKEIDAVVHEGVLMLLSPIWHKLLAVVQRIAQHHGLKQTAVCTQVSISGAAVGNTRQCIRKVNRINDTAD